MSRDHVKTLTLEQLRAELAYWQTRIGVREAAVRRVREIEQEIKFRNDSADRVTKRV